MFDRAISLALFSLVWVPFFTSYATSANFYLFWTTWTILVFSLLKLRLELTSTLIIRFLFYCLPSVLGFAFDMLLPDASTSIKAFGAQGLPAGQLLQKYRRLEFEIAGWSLLNVGLGIAMQALFEILATKLLGLSSLIKVSSVLPLPEEVFKKLIFGLMLRGVS